jgi:hypothetical protein
MDCSALAALFSLNRTQAVVSNLINSSATAAYLADPFLSSPKEMVNTWLPFVAPFALLAGFVLLGWLLFCFLGGENRSDSHRLEDYELCFMMMYLVCGATLLASILCVFFALDYLNEAARTACTLQNSMTYFLDGYSSATGIPILGMNNMLNTSSLVSAVAIHSAMIKNELSLYSNPLVDLSTYIDPINPICSPFVVYLPNSSATLRLDFATTAC